MAEFPSKVTIIEPGKVIAYSDNVFVKEENKFKFKGEKKVVGEVVRPGIPGYWIVRIIKSSGINPDPSGVEVSKPAFNLMQGYDISGMDFSGFFMKSGGHLEGEENGKRVALDNASKGGMSVGSKHTEGGIKGVVGTQSKPIEFEGEEIILTAPVSDNPEKYEFDGKMMTGREIASKINVDNGGVAFADGGSVACKCGGKTYKYGGSSMKDSDILKALHGYSKKDLDKGIKMERDEHYQTLSKLNAGTITVDQAVREIAEAHLKENPSYYSNYKN